ncbi:hypothetical protein LIER_23675 [Lithospermum erythrorhizon]|uniref:Uncharacterized protein n=1 Tax=Lithospermum erythrorhizon TaxID=34254 RepID=A0AAV3QZV8_LITER
MKKGAPFTWDEAGSATFQDIKSYLTSPSVLAAPRQGKPLILYIAAQENDEGSFGKLDLKSKSNQVRNVQASAIKSVGQMVSATATVRDYIRITESSERTNAHRLPGRSSPPCRVGIV